MSQVFTKQARKSVRGVTFAPGRADDGSYMLYKLCLNYDGNMRGGVSKTWRYCKKDMTLDEAKAAFEKAVGYKLYDTAA